MQGAAFLVAAEHPCLAGHFPGNPVVPGVLLLDEVLCRVPGAVGLDRVRFSAPVLPGEEVRLSLGAGPQGGVDFVGRVGERVVFRGRARTR